MKGTCEHGEFELLDGCPQCIEARQDAEVNSPENIQKRIEAVQPKKETAITLRPSEDIEAHGYYEESMRLLEYAEKRVIATLEQAQSATNDLSVISKLTKAMDDKRKALLSPLEAKKVEIRDTYKYLMGPVIKANEITRGKMTAYDIEQRRIQREQEEINRKRMEAAQAEMKLKGEITESVNLVEVIEAPKRIFTEMGTISQTDHWKHEVVDFALLDDAYKIADTVMLNSIAKKHHDTKQVPGVRFYNEPFTTVRPK